MDENTFECPHCGAMIYPEMTRCPQCGQNMYPEDEPAGTEVQQTDPVSSWKSALGAVVIGWLVATGIAVIIHFLVAGFTTPNMPGTLGIILLFLAGPVGALAGGYVCASLDKQHPRLSGAVMAFAALPVLVLLATRWVQVAPGWILSPSILTAGLLTVLAGAGGGWMNILLSQNGDWKERWKLRSWEDMLYRELLRKVRFNGSAADRLIEYERRLDPQASRLKLLQNALERWEGDSR